jgi:SpoIID/LytB domain protein
MLLKKARSSATPPPSPVRRRHSEDEIIRWYDREDHGQFDVCADDHCQRYQGIAGQGRAADAVRDTRGLFLSWRGEVCDARFHKACGGLTERFGTAWEDIDVPYLASVSDGPAAFDPADTEQRARLWLHSRPDAYCSIRDTDFLAGILPDYDRETADFFRWQLAHDRRDLEKIIENKSQMEMGTLREILPLARGPSGRIHRLRIVGSRRSLEIGKELEIRRWLSPSHLYSSAFTITAQGGTADAPERFVFHGGGWGHGVGLCQIGAAVMAQRGFSTEDILAHYFPGASLERRYR